MNTGKSDYREMIRSIQQENLKSLKKLDEICKKYQLQYWVAYGSLLGTIRHQGFIPWDDDLDVGMMREDFDRLCEVPAEEWGEDCIFCGPDSDDPRHDKMFGRVYRKNTRIQSRGDVENWAILGTGEAFSTSLMLDIFVFDWVPEDHAEFMKLYNRLMPMAVSRYKRTKYWYRTPGHSPMELAKLVIKNAYGIYMRKRYDRPWAHLAEVNRKEALAVGGNGIGCLCVRDENNFTKEDYFPLVMMKFEDMEVPVPRNYDKMLRKWYGDYMQFPPEDQRYHIQFIYVDLGNGQKYIVDPIKGSLGEGQEINVER